MNLDLMSDPKFFQMITTEEDALLFLQSHGLILSNPYCCNKSMVMRKRSDGKNKRYFFRCNVKDCRREFSIKKGSFFENSHLELKQMVYIIYYFVRDNQRQDDLMRNVEIESEHTIVDWKNFCREICASHFLRNPVVLGGINEIVEIDESSIVKRKYERGRLVRTQWVFGGYQPSIKQGFLV
ncbi:hypothetical protein H312_03236, partial [Anncaliia algerae PRA339]